MKTPEQLAEYVAAARSWQLTSTDAEMLLDALGDEPPSKAVAKRRVRQRAEKRRYAAAKKAKERE